MSTPNQRHLFAGEMLLVSEIHARVPVIPKSTIRKYLAEGINTKAGMLSHSMSAKKRSGVAGRQGRAGKGYNESYSNKANARKKAEASGFVPRTP
jgi:hypothetical protein